MIYQSGTEVLAAGRPKTIAFPAVMSSTSYTLVWMCYDPTTLETVGCTIDPALRTVTGFTAEAIIDAVLEYQAQEYGSEIALIPQSGLLSRDWTAKKFYAELVRDLGLTTRNAVYGERFNIINRAIAAAVASNSAVLGNAYNSTQTIVSTTATDVSISNVRMQLGGPEQRIAMHSSLSNFVDEVEFEELHCFRSAAYQNKGRIVWTRKGDMLYFDRSTSLASYGTRTMHYTRQPELCTADADMLDFPDALMQAAITEGKKILAQRYREIVGPMQFPDDAGMIAEKKADKTAQIHATRSPEGAL